MCVMDRRPPYRPEGSSPEPEIIPPDHGPPDHDGRARFDRDARIRIMLGRNGFDRIYIGKPGPFALILASLVLGLVGLTIAIVAFGAFLLWLPVTVLVVAGLVLSSAVRGYFRRLN
jgi:hypothetical protein